MRRANSWVDGSTVVGMDESDAQDELSRLREPTVVAYVPPPPGSREKVLPESVLKLIGTEVYLSTACGTARRVEMKANSSYSLYRLAGELHGQCRLTHKYTYEACVCSCHPQGTNESNTSDPV